MKTIFILLTTLAFYPLSAQENKDTANIPVVGMGIDRKNDREKRIKEYADSLKSYKGESLPDFLLNNCLDMKRDLWQGFHSPVSVRWKILEQVTERRPLKLILKTRDKRLRRRCNYDKVRNPEVKVPLIKESFKALIRKRLRQLK